MKEKYYEELYKRWFAWKKAARDVDRVYTSIEEYEMYTSQYTDRTKDMCSWLVVLQSASKEEWDADKKQLAYFFTAAGKEFLAFLENFMQTK